MSLLPNEFDDDSSDPFGDEGRQFALARFGTDDGECLFCGERLEMELFEVWSFRDFMLSTCCEGLHQAVSELLAEEGKEGAELLRAVGVEVLAGAGEIRRAVDDGCGQLVLDWNPRVCSVTQSEAKQFVREHHKHCPRPPVGWKFGAGLKNGRDLIAVVMVGRPVARMIDHTKVVEVNRLCVRRDVPAGLTWNACSMLYAHAAKEAKRLGFEDLVTYTLQSESAHSLLAAGWKFDRKTRGGSWSTPSRERTDGAPTEPKIRWRKRLRKVKGDVLPALAVVQENKRISGPASNEEQLPLLAMAA